MGVRRRGRQTALQILYGIEFHRGEASTGQERFWSHLAPMGLPVPDEEDEEAPEAAAGAPPADVRAFATTLAEGVLEHQGALDARISEASTNWRLERMARVDRNILRIGAYELVHRSEIPTGATISEAVELGRRYGTEDSPLFINGVLDRVATLAGQS